MTDWHATDPHADDRLHPTDPHAGDRPHSTDPHTPDPHAPDWHAPDDLAFRYADGSLPEADAWSLEKHLEHCTPCASRVSRAVRETAAGAVLAEVRQSVLRAAPKSARKPAPAPAPAPSPTPARAPAPRLARVLWAAGPALRGAWLSAVLIVAVGAVVLAYGAGYTGARPLLLAVAPVVPVIGVALSYGAYADPLHEITASTPSAGLRLVLVRAAAVLVVSLPLLTLAGVLVPSSGAPGAAAWLLPGLALTLASLALAGYVGCPAATAVTGGGWLCAVLAPALAAPGGRLTARLADQLATVLDGAPAQGAWAAAAVLSAVALAVRRPAYDHLGRP
ncbi:zf-HC2 domain-containing protein [Streptomyces lincolnensis]|uniref:zf-HC2 domain-containing protein n=1 Tax=Streptomyces lincolnensis TaxID=1915 RepID=UPI001E29518E|nr:zf-HC2 domain-containing protein [Streptomyces lincolnensis]MCD7439978.1 zf-HC2 domain-containing protein [Streptomyces lincolnensis]